MSEDSNVGRSDSAPHTNLREPSSASSRPHGRSWTPPLRWFERQRPIRSLTLLRLKTVVHFAVPAVVLTLELLGCDGKQTTTPAHASRVPLMSVGAATSLDVAEPDPFSGGGTIDVAKYFETKLMPDVAQCTNQVQEIGRKWAADQKLDVIKDDPRPGDLILHVTGRELKGFIELTYTFTTTGGGARARVTLWYYTFDASRHEPKAIRELLEKHDVSGLQDKLVVALRCTPP